MKRTTLIPLLIIGVLVFLLSYIVSSIPVLRSLELRTIDWRFSWRGIESVKDDPVVIVAIDDQSFESLPDRWPWPRSYYAHVIQNLTRAGARVIGLDLIFDKPDPYGSEKDQQLAQAIQQSGRVVLTGKLEETVGRARYSFLVKPIPLFLHADSTWGVVAIQADQDGMYRRYFIGQNYNGHWLPSFGLQVLRKYLGYDPHVELIREKKGFRFGDIFIPLYDQNTMLIDFAGPRKTFSYYSFDTVIDDETFNLKEEYDLDYFNELLKEGVFRDKIVLIGSTVSELHDNFPTPFLEYTDAHGKTVKAEMPGVEIHANAIRTILNGLYYHPIHPLAFFLIIVVLIFLTQFFTYRLSTILATIITLFLIFFYSLAQFYLFAHFRILMAMVFPTIAIFLSFVGTNLYQYVKTQKEKQIIMGAFQHYVPEKVVNELLAHPEKLTLGGEERFMTVLFTDVANFTSISENLTPRELVNLINEYLSEMTNIILKYDGIIDKYEGDAIMAEFGAPVYFEDHAIKACAAALEMQQRLRELGEKWKKQGRPVLTCRVGINSGTMIVGNMGSDKVFDYTVLGDEVNLASRLEGANKIFKTRIMISESTHNLVKDHFITRPLDFIRVKGKTKPVQVFELIAHKNDKIQDAYKDILPIYVNGIRYYQTRQWDKAIECFSYCLRIKPDDGPSEQYLQRVKAYQKNPPPPNWDGVFTLTTK